MTTAKKVVVKKASVSKPVTDAQVTLWFKKETANFYAFEEAGSDRITTGAFYFRKDIFGGTQPSKVVLTVRPVF